MDRENTKAERLREHAEFLRASARWLKPDDKNRTTVLNMTYYFDNLAEAAENEARRSLPSAIERSKARDRLLPGV